jgi:Ni,Fe-hydrogenase III component G
MALQQWFDRAAQQSELNGGRVISGAPKALGLSVTRQEWRQSAEDVAAENGRLLALWASRDGNGENIVRAAFIADAGVLLLSLPLTAAEADYPGIEHWFPAANRMQRAVADLSGVPTTDPDVRPWLRHAAWPITRDTRR